MRSLPVLVALITIPLFAGTASAEEDKAEVVKYRQLEMGAIGRHFGAVKRIVKGQVERPQDLLGHTAALVALIAWVGFMTQFIVYVAVARWRRARRYRRRALP